MYVTENMIKVFLDDLKETIGKCNIVGESYVEVFAFSEGIGAEVIDGEVSHIGGDLKALVKNMEENWLFSRRELSKYQRYFKEDDESRKCFYPGDGFGSVDCVSVKVFFNFGDKVTKYDGTKYFEAKDKLYAFLKELTGWFEFLILDKGEYCSIGDYFDYKYSTGEMRVTGRVKPSREEMIKLSKLVEDLLIAVGSMPVKLTGVWVDVRSSETKNLYFYPVNGEFILWHDASKWKGVRQLFSR